MKSIFKFAFLPLLFVGCSSGDLLQDNINVDSLANVYQFVNDSIKLDEPQTVGNIVYIEHTKNIDAILKYAFPILTLLLGVILDRIFLKIEKKKNIKKSGKRWLTEISSLKRPLQQQIEGMENFIAVYCENENDFIFPSFGKYESLNCKTFDAFKKDELYDYLVHVMPKEEGIDSFHRVINIINSTTDCYSILVNQFQEFLKKKNRLILECQTSMNTWSRTLVGYPKYKDLLGDNYGTLLQLYNKEVLQKQPNINLFELQTSFVQPIIQIFLKDAVHFEDLLNPLYGINDNINQLRLEKKYLKGIFTKLIDLFKDIIQSIDHLDTRLSR